MSSDMLYQAAADEELRPDYTPDELDLFFDQLAFQTRNSKVPLGREATVPLTSEELAKHIEDMKHEMKTCTIEFPPILQVQPLKRKHFRAGKLKIPVEIDLKKYEFALVTVPVMLVPAKGWGLNALDCMLEFNPGSPPEQLPIAHDVFPSEVWKKVFSASQQLSVGLNEYANFKPVGGVPLIAEAGIGLDASAGAKMLMAFKYEVCLPKVVARGCGNAKVRWVLEGKEFVERKEVSLSVVIKVPYGIRPIKVLGVMNVRRYFNTLFAPIQYLVEGLPERAKNFFKQGAPIPARDRIWDISKDL